MAELLQSLAVQTRKDFEIVIVEDGSVQKSDFLISQFDLNIQYHFKPNTGPGDSRNFGMSVAKGEYMIFFDSDCVIPPDYFEHLDAGIAEFTPDAFGGPDAAHPGFSNLQKAINYSMTSFLTTGGIRGGKRQLDRYQPRSFNMGISRAVYEAVGGFGDIHPGEDPDLSFRIMKADFKVALIPDAKVYHKRRIDLNKFAQQVYKFGVVRVILNRWHPGTGKLVYWLPSLFLLGLVVLIVMSFALTPWFLLLMCLYALMVFFAAIIVGNGLTVSFLAVPAAFVQLCGYGWGFIKSYWKLNILGRHERKAFPKFFFGKK